MTTVAANRECMAADSFLHNGNSVLKIVEGDGILIGLIGDIFYAHMLARWVLTGARGMAPVWEEIWRYDKDDNACDTVLLILRRDGLFLLDGRGQPVPMGDFAADGTGCDQALGILRAGGTPTDAVLRACETDPATKPPVITRSLVNARAPKRPYWPDLGEWPGQPRKRK